MNTYAAIDLHSFFGQTSENDLLQAGADLRAKSGGS